MTAKMSKYSRISTEAELEKALKEVRKEVKASGHRLSRRYDSFTRSVSPFSAVTSFVGRPRTAEFFSGLAVAISIIRKLKRKKKRV